MNPNGTSVEVRAADLVYTSVDDLRSSLPHYRLIDADIVRAALELAEKKEYKTKAKLLRAWLKKNTL